MTAYPTMTPEQEGLQVWRVPLAAEVEAESAQQAYADAGALQAVAGGHGFRVVLGPLDAVEAWRGGSMVAAPRRAVVIPRSPSVAPLPEPSPDVRGINSKLLSALGIAAPPERWPEEWLERGCTRPDIEWAIDQAREKGANATAYVDAILRGILTDRKAGRAPRYERQRGGMGTPTIGTDRNPASAYGRVVRRTFGEEA